MLKTSLFKVLSASAQQSRRFLSGRLPLISVMPLQSVPPKGHCHVTNPPSQQLYHDHAQSTGGSNSMQEQVKSSLTPGNAPKIEDAKTDDWELWDYANVKKVVDSNDRNITIIDVREPHEYAEGHIPNALNMPIMSYSKALDLPADEFQERFAFPKPSADSPVLFYCKAGKRGTMSAKLAKQAGFQNVMEYRGSWDDWTAKNQSK